MNFVIHFLLTCGLYIFQGSFSNKDVTTYFENFLVVQGFLMGCDIIFKCDEYSLMFQNYFLTRIPYSSSYIRK